jgi:hypothetical protein
MVGRPFDAGRKAILLLVCQSLLFSVAPVDAWSKKKEEPKPKPNKPFVASGKWEPFLTDAEGRDLEIAQPLEANVEEDWIGLRFTPYNGRRTKLAVMPMFIAGQVTGSGNGILLPLSHVGDVEVNSIESLLTSALFGTNRFELVERQAVDLILTEQEFGKSGHVTPHTAAKIGRVLGASYLILMDVNEWTGDRERKGIAKLGIGHNVTDVEVAMSFRIIDTKTGQLIYAKTSRGKAGNWGFQIPVFSKQQVAPMNYALTVAIHKAVYDLALTLGDRSVPWSGSVVKVDGEVVTLNSGSNAGLVPGDVLTVMSKGEELFDPDTGASLGFDGEVIGSLQITAVQPAFSKAAIIEGCKGMKSGDRLQRRDKAPAPPIPATAPQPGRQR